jgi:hypothetical protein
MMLDESCFPLYGNRNDNRCRGCRSAIRKAAKHKNGQRTRELAREHTRRYREAHKEEIIERMIRVRADNPLLALWRRILERKERLAITRAEFFSSYQVPAMCPILGIPLGFNLSRDNFPSVDRIDPNLPYALGNILICSYRANMLKSVGSAAEHLAIATWMVEHGFGKIFGKPLPAAPAQQTPVVRFGKKHERI